MHCRMFLVDIVIVHKKANNKCKIYDMNNYFQCTPKHFLTSFFKVKIKVCLFLSEAVKTESGYNTRCILCISLAHVPRELR